MRNGNGRRSVVVLFDVDGTLVRTGGSGRRALDFAFEAVWELRGASRGVDFSGKPDLRNFTEVYERHFGRAPTRRELGRVMAAYLRRLPAEVRGSVRAGKYRVIEGAARLLAELAKRPHVRVGLGTGNLERGARAKLAPSGLNRFFRFGGFGADGYDRADILKAGVRRSRARGARVVVVGDTPLDVEAGKRAGYKTVAVTSGFSTAVELRAAAPDHMARDFRPVERWLGWLAGREPRRAGLRRGYGKAGLGVDGRRNGSRR